MFSESTCMDINIVKFSVYFGGVHDDTEREIPQIDGFWKMYVVRNS